MGDHGLELFIQNSVLTLNAVLVDKSEHQSHNSCSDRDHCLVGVVRHKLGKLINR